MIDTNGLTRTHKALLRMLSDGKHHTPEELQTCLYDDLNRKRNPLHWQISTLRKHLQPKGEDIVCQSFGRYVKYIHIRYLSPTEREIYVE